MQEYDVTLKQLITGSADRTLRLLGVMGPISRWLNVELPKVQNRSVDLLAELASGELLHIELQSGNDGGMPLRMLEYAVAICRATGIFPRQIVLYVGNDRLRMANRFQSGGMDYRYDLVDFRDLDSNALIESDCVSDNILASLAGMEDKVAAIHRILEKLERLEQPWERKDAIYRLLVLCGLRGLAGFLRQEGKKMPIDVDIRDHEVIGPIIRKSVEQAEKDLVRMLIEARFGSIPQWAEQRLQDASEPQARHLALRLLNAVSLEELFG